MFEVCDTTLSSNVIFFPFIIHSNNMSGSPQWDDRLMDSLKNFDLSSPEVKQQFGQSSRSL